jgi:hypothetical protein
MLSILGQPRRVCSGLTRRQILQTGGTGMLGLSPPWLLAVEAMAKDASIRPKARSVIFLMLFGGPSQLDTFDMRPDAPERIRGPFRPTACCSPGLFISDHPPETASISDRFCVIRTMTHTFNDHSGDGHYMQTGRRWHVPIGGGFSPTPQGTAASFFGVPFHGF